jgi:tetratricopeptide (TPR) repeat protein
MRFLFGIFLMIHSLSLIAQVDTAESNRLYRASLIYTSKGDFKNVVNVMRVAKNMDRENAIYRRDLSLGLFNMKKHRESKAEIDSCIQLPNADPSCFKFAVKVYSFFDDYKGGLKIINQGLQKFPNSSDLFNAKAELFYNFNKPVKALETWEDALKYAPDDANIYYNLVKILAVDSIAFLKTMHLAESFVLQESFSTRTSEMKKNTANAYRKVFKEIGQGLSNQESSKFDKVKYSDYELQLLKIFKQNRFAMIDGLSLNSIHQLRSSFLNDYQNGVNKNYPSALINYWEDLEKQNLFEAYNIWLFGNYIEPDKYQSWIRANSTTIDALMKYLSEYKLKPQPNEFYFKTKKYEQL